MKFSVQQFVDNLAPVDLTPEIPHAEFRSRIERTMEMLEARSLDVGFAFGNELKPGDVGWLCGYDPHLEDAACIVGRRGVFILGGPEGAAYANEQKRIGEFRSLEELKIPEEDYPGAQFHTVHEVLEAAHGGPVRTVGLLTPPSYLPVAMLRLIESYEGVSAVDASDFLLVQRYAKSANEQRIIRTAARITSYAMEAMVRSLEPGIRENEVAACADYVMRAAGADGRPGVSTLVNSGDRLSNVLGRASNRVIQEGEMVLLGVSARFRGLTSCLSRTLVVGTESQDQRELLDACEAAYLQATEKLGAGLAASGPDTAARSYLKPFGLYPMYSVIHNIGWTEAMEGYGAATQYSNYLFPPNVSLMLDVGVFGIPFKSILPQFMGVRMEDPFIIDAEGRRTKLTDYSMRIKV